jgi:primosomal replication protein N
MSLADNCLMITGWVSTEGKTRCSPAGLPITRFTLEHRSEQVEAGLAREARCRILVLACGEALRQEAENLLPGNRVRVRGFIARANHRHGESRLVLHAERIETLDNVRA